MSTTSKEMGTDYKYELDSEFDNKLANLQLEPIPGRIDLEKEGPSKEDKEASDQIQKPSLLSRIINKLTRPRTAAVVGASLAPAALVAACTPSSQQTEVRPVSPPRAEIQPTPIINTEKLDVREILVEAKDPADMSKKASFKFVENRADQKNNFNSIVLKDGLFQDYSVFATEGAKDQKIHIEYRTLKDRQPTDFAFLDFALDLPAQVQKDKDFQKKVLDAWDQGKINQIIIDDSKVRITYDTKTDQNYIKSLLSQILDEVSPKSVFAAELPKSTPTVAPTPTATKTPEATPTPPQAGYEVKENSIVYKTEKGEVLNIPQVPGLKAEFKGIDGQKKVVYLAEQGNKYGLKEGEKAGSFHPNVSIVKEGVTVVANVESDANLVGGVELRSEVVGPLMEEALAKFEKQEDRYITSIPIDISEIKDQDQILLTETSTVAKSGPYNFIAIQAPAGLSITNPFFGTGKGVDIIPSVQKDALMMPLENSYLDSDKIAKGKEMFYTKIEVSRLAVKLPQTLKNVIFGDIVKYEDFTIFETSMAKHGIDSVTPLSVKGGFWNILMWLGAYQERRVMNFNHVLTVKNPNGSFSPVFLSANK